MDLFAPWLTEPQIDPDACPSEEFVKGTPAGTCQGDGHYRCFGCAHFLPQLAAEGPIREQYLRSGRLPDDYLLYPLPDGSQ